MERYSLADGELLVKAARQAIELHILSPHFRTEMLDGHVGKFIGKQGVFVTIEHYPTRKLRGCAGFLLPSGGLGSQLIEAAIAASEDRRFVSISQLDFEHMTVRVSLLSDLEPIGSRSESGIKRNVRAEDEGLTMKFGYEHVLLMPSVLMGQERKAEISLSEMCAKAGLPAYAWKSPTASIYKFGSQVFGERSPGGRIEELSGGAATR